MKARLWHTTVGGGLYGLLIGIALQICIEIQQKRDAVRLAEEFYPGSPPLTTVLLKPHAIPIAVCVLFATLGSFIYVIWSRRQ